MGAWAAPRGLALAPALRHLVGAGLALLEGGAAPVLPPQRPAGERYGLRLDPGQLEAVQRLARQLRCADSYALRVAVATALHGETGATTAIAEMW